MSDGTPNRFMKVLYGAVLVIAAIVVLSMVVGMLVTVARLGGAG